MTKQEALARFLSVDMDNIQDGLGEEEIAFTYRREEYLVLTDDEADQLAKESILDSVWAFNASFLAVHSDIDQDVIESIQENNKCEDNNKVLIKLINDLDHFVDDAIRCDGRGHFIAHYNSEENEFSYRDNTGTGRILYIYRTN